jgi:hypothetical protein
MTHTRLRALGALLIAVSFVAAGCSSVSPGSYDRLDGWFTGEPSREYSDLGLEYVPAARPVFGLVLAGPYAARDLLRIVGVPFLYPYYAVAGEVPTPFMLGPQRDAPDETEELPLP